jgi:hypothetical protein
VDENNNPLSNYNGALAVTVLIKNTSRNTLRNDRRCNVNDKPFTTALTMPLCTRNYF